MRPQLLSEFFILRTVDLLLVVAFGVMWLLQPFMKLSHQKRHKRRIG